MIARRETATAMPTALDRPARLDLADYFERGSLLKTLRKRHPYDFVDTYHLLGQLYGYDKYYVNLGYWKDGAETVEAGYELVRFLADKLGLEDGAALIDAGAGMGQAAVDLARERRLRRVTGININQRQVRFAVDLSREHGLDEVVEHICGDATEVVQQLEPGAYDAAMAVECIGHFPAPERFLDGLARALAPRGRLVFCLNIADQKPSFLQRRMMKIAYGFVPDSEATWRDRIEATGFQVTDHDDLTDVVLGPAMERSIERLGSTSPSQLGISRLRRWAMGRGCRSVLRAARAGRMSYRYFVIEKRT
jgi:2-polyprenyl-3-methyl-5-hydroxy-6-metoxy-1,4-benzoquinol methylase